MAGARTPDWRATREQAGRCLELARQLVAESAGLDFAASGAGVRLPRRLELVVDALERCATTADRRLAEARKVDERAAQLERLAEERRRAVQATYHRSNV